MVREYDFKEGVKLTHEQLEAAKNTQIVFDDDCPEITPDMLKHAYRPGKPRGGDAVTVRVQIEQKTLDKAKTLGDNYMELLGRLLDDAVKNYKKT